VSTKFRSRVAAMAINGVSLVGNDSAGCDAAPVAIPQIVLV
jgi:hypothetical protein